MGAKADPGIGPTSLADLRKGSNVDGDSGDDPTATPDWFDATRFAKIEPFFREHAITLSVIWHCSLTVGFDIGPLLEALVFTSASSTPKTALPRYLDTFARLIDWHTGDIFHAHPVPTKAFKSTAAVRAIHKGVRTAMQQKQPGTHKLNMYNLATVQTGFMGAATKTPEAFGLKVSEAQLSDYVYFWRCVGRQLGISDEYNLCGRGKANSDAIVNEIIDQLLLPGLAHPPKGFQSMSQAYIDGINLNFGGLPLLSVPSTLAVIFWSLVKKPSFPFVFGIIDILRFYGLYRVLFLLIGYMPGFEKAASELELLVFALRPPPTRAVDMWGGVGNGDEVTCPFTGASVTGSGASCPVGASMAAAAASAAIPARKSETELATVTASSIKFKLAVTAFWSFLFGSIALVWVALGVSTYWASVALWEAASTYLPLLLS
jgi:hypothetical protein